MWQSLTSIKMLWCNVGFLIAPHWLIFFRRTKFPPIHSLWRRPSDTGLVVSSLIIVELRFVRDPMEHSGHKSFSLIIYSNEKVKGYCPFPFNSNWLQSLWKSSGKMSDDWNTVTVIGNRRGGGTGGGGNKERQVDNWWLIDWLQLAEASRIVRWIIDWLKLGRQ